MGGSRKPVKVVVVRPASPDAIRRALKVTASDVKAAKRVISELGLDKAVRRVVKAPTSARAVFSHGDRSHRSR